VKPSPSGGSLQTGARPFFDQPAVELRDGAALIECQLTARCRRVDGIRWRAEADAARVQVLHRDDELLAAASKSTIRIVAA
jgi:hypothetical protein